MIVHYWWVARARRRGRLCRASRPSRSARKAAGRGMPSRGGFRSTAASSATGSTRSLPARSARWWKMASRCCARWSCSKTSPATPTCASAWRRRARAVVDGATLSTALAEQKLFPELFLDMMAVGEQTGRFGGTMQMIADVYERELDQQIQIVSTLIPPLVMIVIAAVVGLVVYGIMSAVFGLTQNLRANVH